MATIQEQMAWARAPNLVINGGMEVSQESVATLVTGITNNNLRFGVDMFGVLVVGSAVLSAQQVADAPPGFSKSLKVSVTTADTVIAATDKALIYTAVEGYRAQRLLLGSASANAMALAFSVKANRPGNYSASVENWDVNRAYPFTWTINSAGVWEYKQIVIPGDIAGTWQTNNNAGLYINWVMMAGTNFTGTANQWNAARTEAVTGTINGVAATSDYLQIGGVSLIVGNTPVSQAIAPQLVRPFNEEMRFSQRYFEKSFAYAEVPASNSGTGEYSAPAVTTGGTQRLPMVRFNTRKASPPAMTIYNPRASGNQVRNITGNSTCTGTAVTVEGEDGFYVECSGSSNTAGDRLAFAWTADSRM